MQSNAVLHIWNDNSNFNVAVVYLFIWIFIWVYMMCFQVLEAKLTDTTTWCFQAPVLESLFCYLFVVWLGSYNFHIYII